MPSRASPSDQQVRTAEIIASLCLATDLGMGFPFEHGLHATLISTRLCDALDVDTETASQAYYAGLLMHIGCTTNADVGADIFHGSLTKTGMHRMYGSPLDGLRGILSALPAPAESLPVRAYQVVTGAPKVARVRKPHFTAVCEVAEMLAEQLGLPPTTQRLFPFLNERWDGWGHLRRAKGDEVPLALRIVHVSHDAAFQRLIGDEQHVVDTIRARGGHAFDPRVVEVFVENAPDILGAEGSPESVWEEVLGAEPRPWLALEGSSIDRALAAMGRFADLASPHLSGHSTGVGVLAHKAAELYGFDGDEALMLRRAGCLLDVGKTAVHPRIWEKEGPLTADEWEQVRLHPYHTERVLLRSSFLAPLGTLAFAHHERLDGSGYPRSLVAGVLTPSARLLAAADAFRSKVESRAYRPPYSAAEAARILATRANEGRLDPDMVSAVVTAAGEEMPPVERPAGLTEREVEVVGLLARGMQTKQVATALGISVKTADRHIQNAYRKIGVSTRAAATLFAAEHGLVPWGELPITNA